MDPLPPPRSNQTYVTVSAITNGTFTLPEHCFVSQSDTSARRTVPSLSFLIIHPSPASGPGPDPDSDSGPSDEHNHSVKRLLFDLGLRGHASRYTAAQQKHLRTRQPYHLGPTVRQRLEAHHISADSIDAVLLSHVHWDHTGDPSDFANAEFLLGSGGVEVLRNGLGGKGSHQHFDPELLPRERTRELPEVMGGEWSGLGPFEHVLDLYADGSVYVIDLRGHLPGHVGLLCRVDERKWVCLCGDAYHDVRLRTGEREIGTWDVEDENGEWQTMCIHLNKEKAKETIKCLARVAEVEGVEVIAAHDEGWVERNRHRLFPKTL